MQPPVRLKQDHGIRRVVALAAAVVCAGAPGAALAASDPPSKGVDHSREVYTLDGHPSTAAAAGADGNSCAATPNADGVVACFTSEAGMLKASVAALQQRTVPPGWLALPPGVSYRALASQFQNELARASSARVHRRHARVKARAASGYSCNPNYHNTHIWTNASWSGTQGDQGYTGVNNWPNYSSTFDNKVSSFHATSANWQTRWHDYAYGQGAYYGPEPPCYYVESLTHANMTDGGTANDRFSSYGDW